MSGQNDNERKEDKHLMAHLENILDKERRFTETEVITMEQWLIAALSGDAARADRILRAGLHFEHWDALLSEHPEERTPEQIAQFESYKQAFLQSIAPAQAPTAIVDATFEPVVGGQDLR